MYLKSCQTAVAELSQKYEIIGEPIDLSILDQKDGHQAVFELLLSNHRSCYTDHQRIITVQPESDTYDYLEDGASASLIFLQQCLQKIDISNFFVICRIFAENFPLTNHED